MQPIVTLTMNPAIDLSASVDRVVTNHKLRCKPPRYEPGGGGINVGRAIHNLGGEAVAYYPAGGATGQALRELLDQEGVNHHASDCMSSWSSSEPRACQEGVNRR